MSATRSRLEMVKSTRRDDTANRRHNSGGPGIGLLQRARWWQRRLRETGMRETGVS